MLKFKVILRREVWSIHGPCVSTITRVVAAKDAEDAMQEFFNELGTMPCWFGDWTIEAHNAPTNF